ncbi:sigma-54 interaction domain-containing protein [Zhaonella formicivorans]|uniref:sigma-54 interaction domain-containing protein n=1 Tax=Zhaonella formicivorans TaxID=2528593 RepID=UPI0010F2F281|nr:sigma 54-interacting transcriptional regulator [Zhaonella formicivorans]
MLKKLSQNIHPQDLADPKIIPVLWQYLLTLEAQLEAVLETVNEAVTIIDRDDVVVGWSRRAQEMYKIAPESILGQKIEDFFSSLVVTGVLNNGEVRDSYHQPCRGTHVLINASPIRLGGEIIGSVGAERDITETVYLHNELSKASHQVRLLEEEIKKFAPGESFTKIRGKSKKLGEIVSLAKKVAGTNAAVLIRGESGTGKGLFAEAIHQESQRGAGPFVIVNCGAIPPSLFESELFGCQEGSGGYDQKGKPGKFELANGGTIFFDEVDSLQLDMQVKLLRALQTKKIYRLGAEEPIMVDVRVVAATNRDLEKLVAQGLFREDLYYQLNVVAVDIPPLRERKDDLPELVYLFVQEFSALHGREIREIEPELMSILLSYPWPGNIRELRNVIERLVILAEGEKISAAHLPDSLRNIKAMADAENVSNLCELTERAERQMILRTLEEAGGNKSKAAKLLGIPRSTLYYKLKNLNLL